MRELHFSDLSRTRTGISSAFMPEQFVFDETVGYRGTVQRHKSRMGPRTQMMNCARENFLARPAFTEQQDCRLRRGHALRHLACVLHRRMLSDDSRETIANRVLLAQQQIFTQQFLLLSRTLQQQFQVIEIHRLLDEIERAFFHRRDGFFHRSVRRHQNDRQRCFNLAGLTKDIQARTSGQFQVRENQLIPAAANFLNR